MRPITTREGNKVSLDLTTPFLLWFACFGTAAFVWKSWTLFWIALIPAYLTVFFVFIALVIALGWWISGEEITITKRDGTTRKVQRR